MAGKAKALGILVGIAGLALVASVAFAAEKPAADSPEDDDDGVAEQQYKSAMDPGQTESGLCPVCRRVAGGLWATSRPRRKGSREALCSGL